MGTQPTKTRIADAARTLFIRDGVRATSLDRVADLAGVSRMTVYRHFPGKATLVREVVLADVAGEVDRFDALWGAEEPLEERLVAAFVWSVETARRNPMLTRMLETEPEALLPALTLDGAMLLETASALLAERLRSEHFDDEHARTIAELLCRLVLSLVLQPYGRLRLEGRDELSAFAREWIAPALRTALDADVARSMRDDART